MRTVVADVLVVAGLVLIASAGYMVWMPLGLFATGCPLFFAGLSLARIKK
jgi:hypothetical protein